MELICIESFLDFKKGSIYHSVGEDSYTCDYDTFEEYIFYGDYDYERDIWEEIRVDKEYFVTPAEWRDKQIDSILND
jgi:hypothetical protein